MRIITGLLKGRNIEVPANTDIRPTTGRTKEGVFSTILSRRFMENARVLDLFAGTGNYGFEAISRGAAQVTFIDRDKYLLRRIEEYGREFDIEDQIRTRRAEVEQFLEGPPLPSDFIFCDPPYKYETFDRILDPIFDNGWLNEAGWLIVEHNKYNRFEEHPHCYITKEYGRTLITIFTAETVDQDDKIFD